MRQAILILILVAVAGVLAHLHVAAQSYFPVAKLATPDGFTFTAVQQVTGERNDCGAANKRFVDPIKAKCKDCRVLYARCERKLEGVELMLSMGYAEPDHMVVAPGLRMKVEGPRDKAKGMCDEIAVDMARRGLQSATCIYPRQAGKGGQTPISSK